MSITKQLVVHSQEEMQHPAAPRLSAMVANWISGAPRQAPEGGDDQ